VAIQVLGDQSAARRDANVQITRSLLEVTAEVKNKYSGKMARSSHSTSTQTEHSRRKSEERRPFQAKTRRGMGVTMWVLPPEKQAPAVEAGPRTPGPRRGDDEEAGATELGYCRKRNLSSDHFSRDPVSRDPVSRDRVSRDRGPSPLDAATRRTPLRYRMAANRSHAGDADRPFPCGDLEFALAGGSFRNGNFSSCFPSLFASPSQSTPRTGPRNGARVLRHRIGVGNAQLSGGFYVSKMA
jgi:hypothetical protein